MKITNRLQTDVLVIGAGGAGLRAALAAAEAGSQVLLTNKGPVAKSGITLTAAGGMQAPFHSTDSADHYFADTVKYGYGLADQNLVRVLADDACDRASDAERYGARFILDDEGNYALAQFPGQSKPRNLFFKGGGVGLAAALAKACRTHEKITIRDDFYVTGLVRAASASKAAVAGAVGLDLKTGELMLIDAKAVILATGGCQWLWEINDCPTDATGDGIIYAYRAGAELVDMEMVLFYPSVIVWPPSLKGAFVHYEFLDQAILDGNVYDKNGDAVFPKPLPVRDEAMRMMAKAIRDGRGTPHGGLLWYVGDSPKGPEAVHKKLNIAQYNYIRSHGVEPATDKIEVAPGAHYLMGGIYIDEKCQTTLSGLFATPECAGNFDGANRLAGSGLTAIQVFGAKAGLSAHEWATANGYADVDPTSLAEETARVTDRLTTRQYAGASIKVLQNRLRSSVQEGAGVTRDAAGLKQLQFIAKEVQSELAQVKVPAATVYNQHLVDVLQLEIMCEVALLVGASALLREESRGHHFRADFPQQHADWRKHTLVSKGEAGLNLNSKPVIEL